MANGLIQVPPDSTGKNVDAASLDVGTSSVIRQRMIIGDNSATAQFATVTNGALLVTGNFSGTSVVILATGTSNIGTLNDISRTVQVAIGTPFTVNNISATVNTVVGAGTALMGAVSLAAGTANIGFINGISATVTVVGIVNISATASVILAAGTANIGSINNISRTVAIVCSTPFIIDGISQTVTVVSSTPWIVNIQSASHGPKVLQLSTSATATLIAAPGAGNFVYVTQLIFSNAGTINTTAHIGWSGSPDTVLMYAVSSGGNFIINFDPPWKVQSNEVVQCRVKPNTVGNCYLNVNFFVNAT